MSKPKQKKSSMDELLQGCVENAPSPEDPIPCILDSEWPPYQAEIKPFAYRVVDWRGQHVAVVGSRRRAHEIKSQTDFDPRLNWIYAIYPDETETCIQSGMTVLDDLDDRDVKAKWKASMQAAGIEDDEIEKTLSYYRNIKAKAHEH